MLYASIRTEYFRSIANSVFYYESMHFVLLNVFKLKYIQRRKELEDAFNALPLDMEEKKEIEDQVHQIQEIVAQSNIDEVNQVPENFDIGDFA